MARRIFSIFIFFLIILATLYETLIWLMQGEPMFPREFITLGIMGGALLGFFVLSGGSKGKKDRQNKIVIKEDKNSILIAEAAIISMVRNALARVSQVKSGDIRVLHGKEGRISLRIAVILDAGSDVVTVAGQIEEEVHQTFSAFLEDRLERVEVTIQGFQEIQQQ